MPMTITEMVAGLRAFLTQAEAGDADPQTETPPVETPPTETPPAETPSAETPNLDARIAAAVTAALAAQTETSPTSPTDNPVAQEAINQAVAAGMAAIQQQRLSGGPPANQQVGLTLAQADAMTGAQLLENKEAVYAMLERERPGRGLARFMD